MTRLGLLSLVSIVALSGCIVIKEKDGATSRSSKEMIYFALAERDNKDLNCDVLGVIDGQKIILRVPESTSVANLIPRFAATGTAVLVDGKRQISGSTPNNFSSPVTYRVIAQDRSIGQHIVLVQPRQVLKPPVANDVGLLWKRLGFTNLPTSDDLRFDKPMKLFVYDGKLWVLGYSNYGGTFHIGIWNSRDGMHWSRVGKTNLPTSDDLRFDKPVNAFTYNNKMRIIGYSNKGGSFHVALWLSGDGLTWARVGKTNLPTSDDFRFDKPMVALTYNNKMRIIGYSNKGGSFHVAQWTSGDGLSWKRAGKTNLPTSDDLRFDKPMGAFTFNGKMWLLGYSNSGGAFHVALWNSEDGLTWTRIGKTDLPTSDDLRFDKPIHAFSFNGSMWVLGYTTAGTKLLTALWNVTGK